MGQVLSFNLINEACIAVLEDQKLVCVHKVGNKLVFGNAAIIAPVLCASKDRTDDSRLVWHDWEVEQSPKLLCTIRFLNNHNVKEMLQQVTGDLKDVIGDDERSSSQHGLVSPASHVQNRCDGVRPTTLLEEIADGILGPTPQRSPPTAPWSAVDNLHGGQRLLGTSWSLAVTVDPSYA